MALVACAECNHSVSELAESCPKCGAPINSAKGKKQVETAVT